MHTFNVQRETGRFTRLQYAGCTSKHNGLAVVVKGQAVSSIMQVDSATLISILLIE